jgi:hypothetical protein
MKGNQCQRGQSCALGTGEWHTGGSLTRATCMVSTIDIVLTMLSAATAAQQQPLGPAPGLGAVRNVFLAQSGPHRGLPLPALVLAPGSPVHSRNLLNVLTSSRMRNGRCATLARPHRLPSTTPTDLAHIQRYVHTLAAYVK